MQLIHLSESLIFEVAGKHAARFLQNRLTNEIASLPINGVTSAAALTPQGRVEGIFTVVRSTPESFQLIADGGDSQGIESSLLRFRVTEQLTVRDLSAELTVIHCIPTAEPLPELRALGGALSVATFGPIIFGQQQSAADIRLIPNRRLREGCGIAGAVNQGFDLLLPIATAQDLTTRAAQQLLFPARYHQARVLSNRAIFPRELNENTLLSEAETRETISFQKGCYVGQEVVAKLDALGRAPRTVTPVRVTATPVAPIITENFAPPSSEILLDDGRNVGRLLSLFPETESSALGFALLKNDSKNLSAPLSTTVDGVRYQICPLQTQR